MRHQLATFGMFLFGLGISPASANWQYTRWEMTPLQVAEASGGAVVASNGAAGQHITGYSIGDVGHYVSGAYKFDAVFHFNAGGLALVHLTLLDGGSQCRDLRHDLEGVYGKPYDEVNRPGIVTSATWQDRKSNNFAAITIIGDGASSTCSVSYSPLATGNAKGL